MDTKLPILVNRFLHYRLTFSQSLSNFVEPFSHHAEEGKNFKTAKQLSKFREEDIDQNFPK